MALHEPPPDWSRLNCTLPPDLYEESLANADRLGETPSRYGRYALELMAEVSKHGFSADTRLLVDVQSTPIPPLDIPTLVGDWVRWPVRLPGSLLNDLNSQADRRNITSARLARQGFRLRNHIISVQAHPYTPVFIDTDNRLIPISLKPPSAPPVPSQPYQVYLPLSVHETSKECAQITNESLKQYGYTAFRLFSKATRHRFGKDTKLLIPLSTERTSIPYLATTPTESKEDRRNVTLFIHPRDRADLEMHAEQGGTSTLEGARRALKFRNFIVNTIGINQPIFLHQGKQVNLAN